MSRGNDHSSGGWSGYSAMDDLPMQTHFIDYTDKY